MDEQLPQVSVTAIAQDSRGFFWIGTQSGVARFNGKEFKNYDRSNTEAFKSNVVKDILIDSNERLWVLTENGVVFADETGFKAVKADHLNFIKPNRMIQYQDALLVSSTAGVHQIRHQTMSPYLDLQESFALAVNDERLFVGGRGRFSIIDEQGISVKMLPESFETAVVTAIKPVREKVWVATSVGLLLFDGKQLNLVKSFPSAANENINDLHLDEQNILWVAAESQLLRFANGKRFKPHEAPSHHRVSRIMADREGALWFGTTDRGLIRITDSWSVRYDHLQGLKENLVWSVAVSPDKQLFVGSQEGIYRLNGDVFELAISPEQLVNSAAYTLYFDPDGRLWVGTKSGLQAFELSLTKVSEVGRWLPGLQIQAIYRDSEKQLWVGTSQGVFLQDKSRSEFLQIGQEPLYKNRSFRSIIEYQNQLYLGTQNGLLRYQSGQGVLQPTEFLSKSFVTSLDQVQDKLIVGTYGEGLAIFDGIKWLPINREQGLIFDSSFSLIEFQGSIWVSGFDGVYRAYLESLEDFVNGNTFQVFAEPILKDSGYMAGSQKAYCCNGAGHAKAALLADAIWYPTRKGALKLQPKKVVRELPLVETYIEQIDSPDGKIDLYFRDSGVHQYDKLEFAARDISFQFNGLTSFDEGLVKYQYRLVGYSSDWKSNGSMRDVFYTNLPPGHYIFEVKASNREGVWNDKPTRLEFRITPLFHETVAFKLLLLVLFSIFLYLFYLFVSHRNQKKVEALEQLILKKTEALILANQDLADANKQLTVHSYTDPLTGIHNRRYFVKQVMSDISHYVRTSDENKQITNMVFILADIDFFKAVNDHYGHNTGDEVLRQVVSLLQANIRDGDYLIRWGGEEFLLVLRPDHVSNVQELCDRLLQAIKLNEFIGAEEETIKLTISLGFCFYPMCKPLVEKWSWEQALELADKGLYQAKHSGRNRWVGYQMQSESLEDFASGKLNVVAESHFQTFSGKG